MAGPAGKLPKIVWPATHPNRRRPRSTGVKGDPGTGRGKQSIYGLVGGDPGGFPNGRRVTDDVVAIELRALAGVTYPLIDTTFKPDAAAGQLTDGLTPASVSDPPLGHFPYLGVPYSGFSNPS